MQTKCDLRNFYFLFFDCFLSSLHDGAIIIRCKLVLKFSKIFFKRKTIYDYFLMSSQRYDFISETVTCANFTKNKQAKEQIIAGYLSNLVASKCNPSKFNKKQSGKSACYRRLFVKLCCEQIIAGRTPPLFQQNV